MRRTPCCDKDSLKKGPWTAEEDEILCNYIKEIGGHGSRRSLPKMRVPISVVASLKKIKALITSHSQLATVLRNSSKLVVNEDGKKIKHQYPLTESDIEELQSRIVVAKNLPEDHCHQNLMKVFCAVGSVKTIRTCPPQTSNSGASSAARLGKVDGMSLSNKLHAFVEYESVELAERAVSTNAFPELAWNYF